MTSYNNIKHIISADKVHKGVHWGWWVFWIIVFWPACIFVALSHFKTMYRVTLEDVDGTMLKKTLSPKEFDELESMLFYRPNNVHDTTYNQQKPESDIILPDSVKLAQDDSEAVEKAANEKEEQELAAGNMFVAVLLVVVTLLGFGITGLFSLVSY
jgi:hypothetical protein